MATLDPFAELAQKIRGVAKGEAKREARPLLHFVVVDTDPLLLHEFDGDRVLEEGDEDFEISDAVDLGEPEVGDRVRVQQDADDDYVALAVIKRGDDG